MTAHDLIDSIFRRPSLGLPGNIRRISQAQFDYLRNLIGADEDGEALRSGAGGMLTWTPSGRNKYVIAPPPVDGKFGMLTKLSNLRPSDAGSLF
jgi:hypothetical protein